DAGLFRAVAGEKLDVFHRQEQLVAAGVMDFQAIVRRPGGFDRAQPDEASDPMIDMNDEIAGGEAWRFGDEGLRPACGASRADQAVAEDVLLTDDRRLGGLEPAFEPQHGERDLRLAQRERLWP